MPLAVGAGGDSRVGAAPQIDLVDPERRADGVEVVDDIAGAVAV
jgi:hypothetical protein